MHCTPLLFFVVCSLLFSKALSNVSLTIVPPTVDAGTKVELRCDATNTDTVTVTAVKIYKVGVTDALKNATETSLTYTIDNASIGNSGNYICSGVTAGDSINSTSVGLIVSVLKDVNIAVRPPATSEGSNVTLTCNATANHPVTLWRFYKNTVLISESVSKEYKFEAREGDASSYFCSARAVTGTIVNSTATNLTVNRLFENPTITFPSSVNSGSNVNMTCTTKLNVDRSLVLWYVFYHGDKIVQPQNESGTYQISSIQTNLSGDYKCEVIGSVGTGIKKTSGLRKLSVNLIVSLENVTVVEGDNASFTCTVEGGEAVDKFVWFKGGVKQADFGPVLNIPNVKFEGDQTVTCQANTTTLQSNVASAILFTYGLSKPSVVGTNTVNEGSKISLNCNGSASPLPKYEWYRNGWTIPGVVTREFSKTIARNESGNYTCVMENAAGLMESDSFKLTVQYMNAPTITIIPDDQYKPLVGEKVTLSCSVTIFKFAGNYELKYTWTNVADHSTSDSSGLSSEMTYKIESVKRSDASNYKCKVREQNSKLESEAQRNLTVYYKPDPLELSPSRLTHEKEIGDKFTVRCSSNSNLGIPVGNLSWLGPDSKVVMRTQNNTLLLDFTVAKRADNGNYNCTAENEIGNATPVSVLLKVLEPPDAPGNVIKVSGTPESVMINWTTPYDGNSPITGYQVNYNEEYGNTEKTEYNITGLLPNVEYKITVQATNNISKRSINSDVLIVKTGESVPTAPRSLKVVTKDDKQNRLFVTWQVPQPTNGDILGYEIQYKIVTRDGKKSTNEQPIKLNVLASENSKELTVLEHYSEYEVKIRASNSAGYGPFHDSVKNRTLPGAPDTVTSVTPIPAERELVIEWTRPTYINGIFKHYTVKKNGIIVGRTNVVTSTSFNITDLKPYTAYNITITTSNTLFSTDSSISQFMTKTAAPDTVTSVTSIPAERELVIEWTRPTYINGIFENYTVKKNGIIVGRTNVVTSTSFNITDLKPYTAYNITITTSNTLFSTDSSISQFMTKTAAPPRYVAKLPKPSEGSVTSDSFEITLVKFNASHGPILSYQVIGKKLSNNQIPEGLPQLYTTADVATGKDGIFQMATVDDPKEFGTSISIKSKSQTNKRKRRAAFNDFTLEPDTYYTVFVRGFVEGGKFQSTGWYTPVQTEQNPDDGLGGGAIAGIVVGIVLALFVFAIIVYCVWKRRKSTRGNKHEDIRIEKFNNTSLRVPVIDPHVPVAADRFEEHVINLKANSNYGFSQEYSSINRELEFPYNHSRLQDNNAKNRYHNVPAYDDTRVILNVIDGEAHTDYINANSIDGFERDREYIASQGPLPETIFDFWRMAWESETTTIVMLTRLVEKGRVKCAQYWPDSGSLALKDILITLTDVQEFPDHVVRTFHVTRTGQAVERNVKQFHYIAWPDFGVPVDPSSVLGFLRKVNNWRGISHGPPVIHCSAGVGRTGTYITIDSQINALKAKGELSVFENVTLLRQQRCLMVQTEDQYVFIHNAMLDYLEAGETEVEASALRDYIRRQSQVDSKTAMTGLMEEFIRLAKSDKKDRFTEANKAANQNKNRYKNVYPYDETRVKLSYKPAIEGSDYVNANYIDSYAHKDYFIATQAPLEATIGDFWRMIWEQNCETIVMLTKEMEGQQVRVHTYWPLKGSPKIEHFILETATETTYADYIVREIKLTNTEAGASRIIRQFQYTTWPENGSPETGVGIVELIGQVQKWNASVNNKIITVHCTAGVGRTGVFIALTNLIERVKTEGVVDVYQTVKKMRQQRTAMVQTRDQYEFCYRALQEYLESFDLYSNFH